MEGRLAPLRIRQEDTQRETAERTARLESRSAVIDPALLAAPGRRKSELPFAYLGMTAALLVATLLRMLLQPVLQLDYPFATFTIAVIIVSCAAGLRPGLYTALLGAAIAIPVFTGFSGPQNILTPTGMVGLGVYLATSITVAIVCGSLRSARKQAELAAGLAKERQKRLEREIDAREEAQDAAREANDRTQGLLDRIAEAMLTVDLDWNILYANEKAANLLKSDEAGLAGRPLWGAVEESQRSELAAVLEQARETGLPVVAEVAKRDLKQWIEYRAYPTPDGVTLFGRDVTEEKRTRTALEDSDERYRAFLAQSSDAIWRFELERPVATDLPFEEQIDLFYRYGYLAECNETMARQYGYRSVEEIRGKRLGDLLPRSDPRSEDYLRSFMKSNYRMDGAESFEFDKEGHRHIYLNNLLGIQQDGVLLRAWGTLRDITRQKQAEAAVRKLNAELERRVEERTLQLRRANRELEAFCYSVSHDLRAPLRSIMAQSNILLEDCADRLDENGCKSLIRLTLAAKNMAQTIDDLLELSSLQRTEMKKEEVDVSELTQFIAQELKTREACSSVDFEIEPSLRAMADKGLLRVALVNLMENACKFAGRGENPRVQIGKCMVDDKIVFFVRDNGVGFDMQYVDKIFRPFERLHRAEDYPGTGIGLANVERVVERHGGRIWAEGEVGKGATFYFTL